MYEDRNIAKLRCMKKIVKIGQRAVRGPTRREISGTRVDRARYHLPFQVITWLETAEYGFTESYLTVFTSN